MPESIQECSSFSISPRLPPELERDIFETAACEDLGCSYQLLFVPKRVYQWIEPMVYRVLLRFTRNNNHVFIPPRRTYPLLEQYEANQEPSSRLRQVSSYTTHLLLHDVHADVATEILKLCSNVQDLALWATREPYRQLAPTLTALRLQRLSVSFYILLSQDNGFQFDPALFPHLTHMQIVDADAKHGGRVWSKLHLLPCLSHLALTPELYPEQSDIRSFVDTLLRESSTLRTLIICPPLPDDLKFEDPRVVVFDTIETGNVGDWEYGARCGQDLWTVAN